jgi:hypothetical protein
MKKEISVVFFIAPNYNNYYLLSISDKTKNPINRYPVERYYTDKMICEYLDIDIKYYRNYLLNNFNVELKDNVLDRYTNILFKDKNDQVIKWLESQILLKKIKGGDEL